MDYQLAYLLSASSDQEEVIVTRENEFFSVYSSKKHELIMSFSQKQAKIDAQAQGKVILLLSSEEHELSSYQGSELADFILHGKREEFEVLIGRDTCITEFGDKHLNVVNFSQQITLYFNESIEVIGTSIYLNRNEETLGIEFRNLKELYVFYSILKFITERCDLNDKIISFDARNQKQMDIKLEIVRNGSEHLVMYKKASKETSFLFKELIVLNEFDGEVEFELIPNKEILTLDLKAFAELKQFLNYCDDETENNTEEVRPKACRTSEMPTRTSYHIQQLIPSASEVHQAVKYLQHTNLRYDKDCKLKFSFPENSIYCTINETAKFESIKIIKQTDTEVLFTINDIYEFATSRREYESLCTHLQTVSNAISNNIPLGEEGGNQEFNFANNSIVNNEVVTEEETNTIIKVKTTDTDKHFALLFSVNNKKLGVKVMEGQKEITEQYVDYIRIVKRGRKTITFEVMPIPNELIGDREEVEQLVNIYQYIKQ